MDVNSFETATPGRATVEDLWALLSEDVDDERDLPITAEDVNAQSARKLAPATGAQDRMRLRLRGPSVDLHQVATRTATATLSAFQEAISSIGALLVDRATTTGRLPLDIVRATELRLTPVLSPGSVIFTMVSRSDDSLTPAGDEALLERSVETLLSVLRGLEDEVPESESMQRVRDLGSRVQKHLRDLARVLVDDGLDLDLDWWTDDDHRDRVTLTRKSAGKLKTGIGETVKDLHEEDLRGHLVTVSTEGGQSLRLEDGTRVRLEVAHDVRPELRRYWDGFVLVHVLTERTTHLVTGRVSETRTIRSITSGDDELVGSDYLFAVDPPAVEELDHAGSERPLELPPGS